LDENPVKRRFRSAQREDCGEDHENPTRNGLLPRNNGKPIREEKSCVERKDVGGQQAQGLGWSSYEREVPLNEDNKGEGRKDGQKKPRGRVGGFCRDPQWTRQGAQHALETAAEKHRKGKK